MESKSTFRSGGGGGRGPALNARVKLLNGYALFTRFLSVT